MHLVMVYAEIRDQDTTAPSTTQPQDTAAPSTAATITHSSHQYEDVSGAARAGGGDYQITLCAAYGVGVGH